MRRVAPTVRATHLAIRGVSVTLAVLGTPVLAHALDWPSGNTSSTTSSATSTAQGTPNDPLEPLRWRHIPTWYASSPPLPRMVLARWDASPSDDARVQSYRAVALRQLDHEDEARAVLARAVAIRPDVLADPDVALTAAYLAARSRDYTTAVDMARRALAQLDVGTSREGLVLEVSRWSMARGPDGLAPAIELLRAWLAVTPGTPLVRATLALALARTRQPEARREAVALAFALRSALRATDGDRDTPLIGPTVLGEGRAAVGLCLLLAGDREGARASVLPLTRAGTIVPPPWRAFQAETLATARRLAPDVQVPTEGSDDAVTTWAPVPATAPTHPGRSR